MNDLRSKLAGRFIVIDGPDGAGKTTQMDRLGAYLRSEGVPLRQVRDPGGTAIGDRIRHILLARESEQMTPRCEMFLYMASRSQLWEQVIAPALEREECVLSDRWISATVAYQGAGGIPPQHVVEAYESVLPGAWPHLTIILDIDTEEGLSRANRAGIGHDRMEAKGLEFHRRVRDLFRQQAQGNPQRFLVLDAIGTIDEVHERLREALINWNWERKDSG
jgi:dTMP kinase